MTSKKSAHLYIKRKLSFPSYYGNNLDALWDILSTISEQVEILLFNKEQLDINLESYTNGLISVFKEAAELNSNIKFRIVDIKRHI